MVTITLITDRRRLAGRELTALVREAAAAGVDRVQVREKDLGGRALRALVTEVVAAAGAAMVLVNSRPDVAVAGGAQGVHLPEDGLPVRDVKRAFPDLVVGASRHSVEGARRAEAEGADFVLMGPVFETPGKEGRVLGLGPLSEAARSLGIPVHAVGGIDAGNARRVVEAGAHGLAAIRPFLQAPAAQVVPALRGAEPA